MALDTFVLIAGQYDNEADAIADYDAVHDAYLELGLIDTYDAAVLTKDDEGNVHIVKKHEEPTRQGAAGGLVAGLAVGAAIALFPAVAIGGALLVGGATGAGLGALAGHVAGGLSRSDLKDLGELLDDGTSGLLGDHRDRRRGSRRGRDHARQEAAEEAGPGRRREGEGRQRRVLLTAAPLGATRMRATSPSRSPAVRRPRAADLAHPRPP